MSTNPKRAGLSLIKHFEGCRLVAYPDPGTGGAPWTIGWGRTTNVKRGDRITQAQADAWLEQEYDDFERKVRALVKVPLTDNQLGALVSFAYNVGTGALGSSTLLRLLNQGQYEDAAKQFARWTKAGGKTLSGLVRRRAAEAALFRK